MNQSLSDTRRSVMRMLSGRLLSCSIVAHRLVADVQKVRFAESSAIALFARCADGGKFKQLSGNNRCLTSRHAARVIGIHCALKLYLNAGHKIVCPLGISKAASFRGGRANDSGSNHRQILGHAAGRLGIGRYGGKGGNYTDIGDFQYTSPVDGLDNSTVESRAAGATGHDVALGARSGVVA